MISNVRGYRNYVRNFMTMEMLKLFPKISNYFPNYEKFNFSIFHPIILNLCLRKFS